MSTNCSFCKELDLSFYRTGDGAVPPQISLGPLDDLQQRPECPVCGLVLGFLQARDLLASLRKSPRRNFVLKPWEMGIEIYHEYDKSRYGTTTRQPRLLGELNVHPDNRSFLSRGEPGSARVSASLLKHFLHSCETKHGPACAVASHGASDRGYVTLLVIDVEQQCLVSFDSNLNCRYIALSYVWGGVTTLQTTRENLFHLMQRNALKDVEDQLAIVVRDAITAVLMMGERYLWVDTLCIVQDDPVWKHQQISQMDLIYSQSILTIAAVSGTNANDGLPGINQNLRIPTLAHVQDVVITRPYSFNEWTLTKTVYETRAWTLQEKVLSRRCLFFTSEQVVFRCGAGIHPENEEEPLIKLTATASVARANTVNPLSRFRPTTDRENNNDAFPWSEAFHNYSFILQDYSGRSLSYPSDILLAFKGIESVFSLEFGERFYCGLPEGIFDQALLWKHSKDTRVTRDTHLTRRISNIFTTHSEEIKAPSWSWAGWVGPVNNLLSLRTITAHHNTIDFIEVHSGKGIHFINRHSDTEPPEMDGDGADVNRGTQKSRFLPENFCSSMPFKTQVLVFSTKVLQNHNCFELEKSTDEYSPGCFWLQDKQYRRCGVIYDDFTGSANHKKQKLGYIALSRTTPDHFPGWKEYSCQQKPPFGTMTDENYKPPSVVNILLVEWKRGDNGSEWAERVSLGAILTDAWEAMDPREKVMKLA